MMGTVPGACNTVGRLCLPGVYLYSSSRNRQNKKWNKHVILK